MHRITQFRRHILANAVCQKFSRCRIVTSIVQNQSKNSKSSSQNVSLIHIIIINARMIMIRLLVGHFYRNGT